MEGIDLTPFMFREKSYFPERIIFSEELPHLYFKNWIVSLRTEKWKLIYYLDENRYELYNLEKDPYELTNLAEKDKKKFQFLMAASEALEIWMKQMAFKTIKQRQPLDEETKKGLRSLGYLQ